jgi:hypothetical protein
MGEYPLDEKTSDVTERPSRRSVLARRGETLAAFLVGTVVCLWAAAYAEAMT